MYKYIFWMYTNNHNRSVFNIIISINGFNIMVKLNGIYFEYIKIICKIFTKYIVPILQVYPNHFVKLL
jgi:hypothetical protein